MGAAPTQVSASEGSHTSWHPQLTGHAAAQPSFSRSAGPLFPCIPSWQRVQQSIQHIAQLVGGHLPGTIALFSWQSSNLEHGRSCQNGKLHPLLSVCCSQLGGRGVRDIPAGSFATCLQALQITLDGDPNLMFCFVSG